MHRASVAVFCFACACPAASTPTTGDSAAGLVPASGEEGAPVDEPQAAANSAAELRIDGFAIGTKFSDLMKRGAPYDKPCDLDRLQEVRRSAVVYAGKECHDQVFPDGTTLLLFLTLGPGDGEIGTDADLAQPIEVVGWMGGNYFSGKANLEVELGAKRAEVDTALGKPTESFMIGTEFEAVTDTPNPKPVGDPLLAHHHGGDRWSVTRSDVAVAFVVGKMPSDANDEQWQSISRLFFHYVAK